MRGLLRARRVLIVLLVVALFGASVPVLILGSDVELKDGGSIDVAVVLGAAVHGAEPSPVFAARLDFARDLVQHGRVRLVLVTGGTRDAAQPSEGDVGRQYLITRGVAPERILVEPRARTTLENLCYAFNIGRAKQLRSYAIVSDPLHLPRAMRFAHDIGMSAEPAATPYTRYRGFWSKLRFLVRESYFYSRRLLAGAREC